MPTYARFVTLDAFTYLAHVFAITGVKDLATAGGVQAAVTRLLPAKERIVSLSDCYVRVEHMVCRSVGVLFWCCHY